MKTLWPKLLIALAVAFAAYLVISELMYENGVDKSADEWCKAHHLSTYNQLRARDICMDPKTRVAVIPE